MISKFGSCADSLGREILYSLEQDVLTVPVAYQDCPFITLERADAANVVSLVQALMDRSDMDVTDDPRMDSYHSLMDRLNGICYSWHSEDSSDLIPGQVAFRE